MHSTTFSPRLHAHGAGWRKGALCHTVHSVSDIAITTRRNGLDLHGKRVGPDPLFVSEFGAGFLGRRWRLARFHERARAAVRPRGLRQHLTTSRRSWPCVWPLLQGACGRHVWCFEATWAMRCRHVSWRVS